jgi:hypothetical protein
MQGQTGIANIVKMTVRLNMFLLPFATLPGVRSDGPGGRSPQLRRNANLFRKLKRAMARSDHYWIWKVILLPLEFFKYMLPPSLMY